jgi:acyl-CoA thioesterase-1
VISRPPETYVRASDSDLSMDMERRASLPGIISANATALAAAVALVASLAACRGGAPSAPRASTTSPAADGTAGSFERPEPRSTPDDRPVVLFVGTSLTAGYGVDPDEAYPALVQAKIDEARLRYRVVNAGVSGETSAGARRRIGWLLRQPVAVLVLETGANDGLRGQDPAATRDNIAAMLAAARRATPSARLVLVAMEALPNYGEDYRRRFRELYPELARESGATLVPFLLRGVAGDPTLNQADGIHPNAAGHRRVAETVWKVLRPLL